MIFMAAPLDPSVRRDVPASYSGARIARIFKNRERQQLR
jgi:hypothetical protein